MSVGPEGDTKRSSETKVGELEVSIPVDEQILGLEISVEDSVGVAVVETFDKLKGEALNSQRLNGRYGQHGQQESRQQRVLSQERDGGRGRAGKEAGRG